MTARDWLKIFFGQHRAMRYRLALADEYARTAIHCAERARSLWSAASQAADTAEQAARAYAALRRTEPDDLDRVTTRILSALDARDELEREDPWAGWKRRAAGASR